MTVVISSTPDFVVVQSKGERRGKFFEEFKIEVRPGSDFFGWSYQDLRALGEGEHKLNWERRL